MARGRLLLLMGLATAVAGPYLTTRLGEQGAAHEASPAPNAPFPAPLVEIPSATSPATALPATALPATALPATALPATALPAMAAPADALEAGGDAILANAPVQDFGAVLRFDVTQQWVVDHWPRITTTLSDTNLEGFRVVLVTGTQRDDLTGTLSYYFDPHRRVQRLTFEGHTGDEQRLVEFLKKHYGFQFYPSLGAGIYLATWNGAPTSVLQVQHAPVIDASNRHMRLKLRLEINRPGLAFGLSPEFRKLLEDGRSAGRW